MSDQCSIDEKQMKYDTRPVFRSRKLVSDCQLFISLVVCRCALDVTFVKDLGPGEQILLIAQNRGLLITFKLEHLASFRTRCHAFKKLGSLIL